VEIHHSPVIARSNEQVTFTATLKDDGKGPTDVQILVNAALAATCNNLSSGDTCTHNAGPFSAYEGTTVSYLAKATDNKGQTDTRGYYYFAVTDSNFNWALNYLPARRTGPVADKIDLVFHRDSDYPSFTGFLDDVEDKIYDVYAEQAIIEKTSNFDKFNFYVYPEIASSNNCGIVDSDANTDIPWRDADAILHTANLGDCTVGSHFTAEGHNTKAFLHESGHGVFGLADEYDGCGTFYFQPATEPNIFDTESGCQSEQTAKGRSTSACWKFTACQGGWWGIHQLTDGTVMIRGLVDDPWGTEAVERVRWVFNQYQ